MSNVSLFAAPLSNVSPVLRQVSAVVRLNSKEYNRDDFVKNQFNHYDLFFEDCTTPNEALVQVRARTSVRVFGPVIHPPWQGISAARSSG